MWQTKKLTLPPSDFAMSMRPFVSDGCEMEFLKVAARSAFWLIDKFSLDRLVRSLGVIAPTGSGLYGTITALIKHITGEPDEVFADFASQRLARMSNVDSWCEDILEVEEAAEVLGRHGCKVMLQEMKSVADRKVEAAASKEDLKKELTAVRARTKPKTQRGKASWSRGASAAEAPSYPARLPPISTISHAETKQYVPHRALHLEELGARSVAGSLAALCSRRAFVGALRRARFDALGIGRPLGEAPQASRVVANRLPDRGLVGVRCRILGRSSRGLETCSATLQLTLHCITCPARPCWFLGDILSGARLEGLSVATLQNTLFAVDFDVPSIASPSGRFQCQVERAGASNVGFYSWSLRPEYLSVGIHTCLGVSVPVALGAGRWCVNCICAREPNRTYTCFSPWVCAMCLS